MKNLEIVSWNINGLRAVLKKGFTNWVKKASPDIVCLQEIKISQNDIKKGDYGINGYFAYFFPAVRPGYSGVAIYTKHEPDQIINGLSIEKFDIEGRAMALVYGKLKIYNVYFPNGKSSEKRLDYKMDFYNSFLRQILKDKEQGFKVIVCGDVNTAHTEIDLARPKDNAKKSGFLPEERKWINKVIENGFVDVYRHFDKSPEKYTWWALRSGARKRNVGWRIDYFFADKRLLKQIKKAEILTDVMGADHCPIMIKLEK